MWNNHLIFTNALYLIIFAVTVHQLTSFFKTCRGSSRSENCRCPKRSVGLRQRKPLRSEATNHRYWSHIPGAVIISCYRLPHDMIIPCPSSCMLTRAQSLLTVKTWKYDRMTDAGDSLERERKSVAQTAATMTARREPCLSERSTAEWAKDAVIGAYG